MNESFISCVSMYEQNIYIMPSISWNIKCSCADDNSMEYHLVAVINAWWGRLSKLNIDDGQKYSVWADIA